MSSINLILFIPSYRYALDRGGFSHIWVKEKRIVVKPAQNRRVYNYALVERKDWFKSRSCQINACSLRSEYIISADAPRPTWANQCKRLTAYRKTSETVKRVHSQVLQQTLKRLEKAFVSIWEQKQK